MDIRHRQSVLSFAGGKLVFSRAAPKMADAVALTTKVEKKPKKFARSRGKAKSKPKVDAGPVKATKRKREPEKKNAGEANDTKKKLRSFVRRRKKREKSKSKSKNKNKNKKKKSPALPESALLKSNQVNCAPEESTPEQIRKDIGRKKMPRPKMMRVSEETTPEILEMEGNLVPSDVTLEAETQHLNRQNMVTGFDGWMEAEIRQMLNSKQETFCLETSAKVDALREQLPRMTRAEEDKWLVEVSPRAQNVCEMGLNCESVCMSNAKGVNPPLRLPCVQKEGFGSYKMCLLCLRNTSTCTLLRLRMDRVSMIQDSCLQTHANYVNLNGEYKKEHTLPIRRDKYEGVVAPMVAHFHSGYNAKEMTDDAGRRKRFWAQDGYTLPSVMPYDVQTSSSAVKANDQNETNRSDALRPHLFAAFPQLKPPDQVTSANAKHWCDVAEELREEIDWTTAKPTAEQWASLRITHYQHILLHKAKSRAGGSYGPSESDVLTAKKLNAYACFVLNAPFFHPVPLASMRSMPIPSIIAKTVPCRCQVRSLVDTVQTLLYSDAKAKLFLEQCVQCSLLGLFPGAKPPCLEARHKLIERTGSSRSLDTSMSTSASLVAVLLRDRLHQVLFFALKESLIYMVNYCVPSLATVLREFHGWDEFCAMVTQSMNRARECMTGDANDLRAFEKSLGFVSKQKIRKLFSRQPSSRDFEMALQTECERKFSVNSRLNESEFLKRLKKYSLMISDTEAPLKWLHAMVYREGLTGTQIKDRRRVIAKLVSSLTDAKKMYLLDGSKIKLKNAVQEAGTWDYILVDVYALANTFRNKRTTHWVQLPAHITIKQIRALRRVFMVPDGTPLAECPSFMGKIGLCESCSSVRSFLTPKRGRASNGLVAFGYCQSLVSDENLGEFYCGRKKLQPDRSASSRGAKTGRALRHAKFFGNNCGDTRLKQLSLIGRILVWRSKMFAICCYCANFFCVDNASWHGDSLCCGECVDSSGRLLFDYQSCAWCLKEFRALKLTSIYCDQRKEHKLCKQCCRQEFFAPPYTLSWKNICDTLSGCKSAANQ